MVKELAAAAMRNGKSRWKWELLSREPINYPVELI